MSSVFLVVSQKRKSSIRMTLIDNFRYYDITRNNVFCSGFPTEVCNSAAFSKKCFRDNVFLFSDDIFRLKNTTNNSLNLKKDRN